MKQPTKRIRARIECFTEMENTDIFFGDFFKKAIQVAWRKWSRDSEAPCPRIIVRHVDCRIPRRKRSKARRAV